MVKILFFGVVAEKAGTRETCLAGGRTLMALMDDLYSSFPSLQNIKFKISVDKTLAPDLTMHIADGAEVALLPPFSGG